MITMNNKVYVILRSWYDFEDEDSNYSEVEEVLDNYYDSQKVVLGLIVDELDSEMEFDKQFETTDFTIENILKQLDRYGAIYFKQKVGYGKTRIEIIEKVINKK